MKYQGCVKFDIEFSNVLSKCLYDKASKLNLTILSSTCNAKFSTCKIFFIDAPTLECATNMLRNEFIKFYKENNFKPTNILYTIKEETIMDTTNGHNADLVKKINYIWARRKEIIENLKLILTTLYRRDKLEANEKGITYNLFNDDFDSFAQVFLTNVCDDVDLEIIIDFVRCKIDYSDKILFSTTKLRY